jgi:hypothetical protein
MEEKMSLFNPLDGMEETVFKPVSGGYIYRAPSPWLFFGGQNYRVDETQKRELASQHRWMLRWTFWLIIIFGAAGGPVAAGFSYNHGVAALVASLLVGLVIGVALNEALVLKVRPIVAGLAPTSETVTRGDVFARQVAVFSPRFVIGFGVLSLVLFALSLTYGLTGPEGWNVNAVVGTVLFGACTIYWTVLYMMKRRRAST